MSEIEIKIELKIKIKIKCKHDFINYFIKVPEQCKILSQIDISQGEKFSPKTEK